MSGRLGAADLLAATDTSIYTVSTDTIATITVNVCNRGLVPIAARVALLDGAIGTLSNEDYIEYDASVCAGGVLERTGIVMSAGQTIVAHSDIADVTVQVWGWEENI